MLSHARQLQCHSACNLGEAVPEHIHHYVENMNPDQSSGQGYSTAPPAYASRLFICRDLQCTSAIFGSVMKQRILRAVPQVGTLASSAAAVQAYTHFMHLP